MQKSDLPSFFYSRRSYRLLCKTFFCMRDTTYFLGSIFFVFSPTVQHNIKARWNVCQFLWVFLWERRWVAIIFSLDRSAMSETRQCSFWYVRCSRQSLRERAYSAIARSLVFLVLPANQQFARTDGNVARERQHNTVNSSVNTSCVESFRARKQIF